MQSQRHYSLFRRILFPYSGEDPLTRKQGLRVLAAWMLFFPLTMSLLTLVIAAIGSFTLYRTILLFGVALLSGVLIFGLLGWVVVSMSNRAARIRQAWKAERGQ
jgi:lipopolysaccharide export LptBFGC system permease protein LptF